MKAVALKRFRDLKTGRLYETWEVFETSPERLAELMGSRYGKLAEEVQEEPEQKPEEPEKRQVRKPRQKVR